MPDEETQESRRLSPMWIVALVGTIFTAIVALFLNSMAADFSAVREDVSTMKTDMAVLKTTVDGLVKRDIPSRTEVTAQLATLRTERDLKIDALTERVRAIETAIRDHLNGNGHKENR